MPFAKHNDGCWHWEYAGPHAGKRSSTFWIVWLFVILFLNVIYGVVVLLQPLSPLMLRVILLSALAVDLFVTLIFALIWVFRRKKKYSYTVNDRVFSPTNSLYSGRYTKLYFDHVKTLSRCRDLDAIILKETIVPIWIYAAPEDYDAVWRFLRERCVNAEVKEDT